MPAASRAVQGGHPCRSRWASVSLALVLALGTAGAARSLVSTAAPATRALFVRGSAGVLAAHALGASVRATHATPSPDAREWESRLRERVREVVLAQPELAAAFVRLAFHDAATRDGSDGGPNGSIRFELDRPANLRLRVPLAAVEEARGALAPSLSLADAIALAGAEAVEAAGGPHIAVELGRRDASSADPETLARPIRATEPRDGVTSTLPDAGLSSVGLRRYFARLGLGERDFVALSGVHGLGRHPSLVGMPRECLRKLTPACLEAAPNRPPFVTSSVDRFSNEYFRALLRWYARDIERGEAFFIPTDVALVVDAGLRRWVTVYARDEGAYRDAFARAYAKLCRVPRDRPYYKQAV